MAKLASGLGIVQHNIALDSMIGGKESIGPLKCLNFCAARQHRQKKARPEKDALENLVSRQRQENRT
jgi:hypothetical protein